MSEPTSPRSDRIAFAIAGVVVLLTAVISIAREASPGWATFQDEVRGIVAARLGAERAAAVPVGIEQIWIEELAIADRCVTCHATIEWGPELADAPHPARSHPPGILEAHPVASFGCTLCHGGQGAATTEDAAHGRVPHWEEPLLDSALAERYDLTAAQLMETRCNACHRHQDEVPGMPLLNAAKAEVKKRRCNLCHVVDGTGETRGPDLTYEGDKHPAHVHFPPDWREAPTVLAWHVAHFLDPQAVVPKTEMRKFPFTRKDVVGLALLVMSWKRTRLPQAWVPR